MLEPTTYDIRLLCDNCGHEGIYKLPVRRVVEDYDREAGRYSGYRKIGNRSHKEILFCTFCQLPHLKVLFWKNDEFLVHEGVPNA